MIIGCGNLLRGDDALGPRLVRRLWELGLGECVRLADGGTAGMNVAFDMRGMSRVVVVDACRTGATPGEIFDVPGEEVQTPPLEAVNMHNFRWDHALAFARWLLKDAYPPRVRVLLVEAAQVEAGTELSAPVSAALERVAQLLWRDYGPGSSRATAPEMREPEVTSAGYLVFPAAIAERHLVSSSVLVKLVGDAIEVSPLAIGGVGGLLLKQRNARGDRAVLVRECLGDALEPGPRVWQWDDRQRVLRLGLHPARCKVADTTTGDAGALVRAGREAGAACHVA
ncbi:MAG: hydrogenase maturation protease [Planctomycetota bacterium]|nr:hydrogenase maturation protease [Planctomycetota bacterium]